MSKIKIYEETRSLYTPQDEQLAETLVRCTYRDDVLLLTAYNKKLKFSLEELLIHLRGIVRSPQLEQIYLMLQNPHNNTLYNLKQCFKYVHEFVVFDCSTLQFKGQKIQNYFQPALDQSAKKIQKFLQKQMSRQVQPSTTQPLLVVKLSPNNYGTLYQINEFIYLKLHQTRLTTNTLKYYPVIHKKFGKISQSNFYEIFTLQNTQLQYTELALFYIEQSLIAKPKVVQLQAMHSAARTIQKHVRTRFRQQDEQFRRRHTPKQTVLLMKAKILDSNAFIFLLSLECDQNQDQKIQVCAKNVSHHCPIQKIVPYKQKLFLQYEVAELRSVGVLLIQKLKLELARNAYKISTDPFEQLYGQVHKNDQLEAFEKTLPLRRAIAAQLTRKFSQNPPFPEASCPSAFLPSDQFYYQLQNLTRKYIKYKQRNLVTYQLQQIPTFQPFSLHWQPQAPEEEYERELPSQKENQSQAHQQEVMLEDLKIYPLDQLLTKKILSLSIDSHYCFDFSINLERNKLRIEISNFSRVLKDLEINLDPYKNSKLVHLIYKYKDDEDKLRHQLKDVCYLLALSLVPSACQNLPPSMINLGALYRESMVMKIQRRFRQVQFITKLNMRNSSKLLRISFLNQEGFVYRLIFRIKASSILVIAMGMRYQLDLNVINQILPSRVLTKKPLLDKVLAKLPNFNQFLNNDLSAFDAGYYRTKYRLLLDVLETQIELKQGELQIKKPFSFSSKATVKRKKHQVSYISAVKKIQHCLRRHFYARQLKFVLDHRENLRISEFMTIRKLNDSKYYFLRLKRNGNDQMAVTAINYCERAQKYHQNFQIDGLINLSTKNVYEFYAEKVFLGQGKLHINMQDTVKVDQKETNQFRFKRVRSRMEAKLIDLKTEGNVNYNVVYSRHKIASESLDCMKVDINLGKLKKAYHHGKLSKIERLRTIAHTSLDCIRCENEELFVNQSRIQPSLVKVQKPQLKLNCHAILNRNTSQIKRHTEILQKTVVRFNQLKFLLQISYVSVKIEKILADGRDQVFSDFETSFVVTSISFADKSEVKWVLQYDDAAQLTGKRSIKEIAQSLQEQIQVLDQRFLFLSKHSRKVPVNLDRERVLVVSFSLVRLIQKYIRNRKFYRNYYLYRFICAKFRETRLLKEVSRFDGKVDYMTMVAEEEADRKLYMYIWELKELSLQTVELPKQHYLKYWCLDQRVCAKALSHLIVVNKGKVYVKKISPDAFKQVFEQIKIE